MQDKFYTAERNAQIVLYLLKQNGIHKVIASPGTTNITVVASMQQDPWFEMYSAADERSAAYIACGLAAETQEPVVLSCTGATASRNYVPGLTEAYYRKLPILAITSTQSISRVGNYIPQVIDRSQIQKDIAVFSTYIGTVKDADDEYDATVKANKAIHYLFKHGGGPVHINLETQYGKNFSIRELPACRVIKYYDLETSFPKINAERVSVFIGTHVQMTEDEVKAIDGFCARYNGVVFCDHASNYHGEYAVFPAILGQQTTFGHLHKSDLLIHIGEVTAGYPVEGVAGQTKEVWRVSKDGEIRDRFQKLTAVFEMSETAFFTHYSTRETTDKHTEYRDECAAIVNNLLAEVPDNLPFSNPWIAKTLAPQIPNGSILHLGILNSIRAWDMFPLNNGVRAYVNSGGFGIDGDVSSLIGASLAQPDKLYFGIIGDLAFFYDLNSLANRHVGNNVRILLVNNGRGTEFRNYNHPAAQFGDAADKYMAAAGHYGNKSHELIKHYAQDLGFRYITASNKEEFLKVYSEFISDDMSKPVIFEVFTDSKDESDALYLLNHLMKPTGKDLAKEVVKKVVGQQGIKAIKKIISK
ncbi:thiamine pyrophosphate-binding protein [Hallella absiana]|uniref:thiamine pyrophosphate-binding protein n=1 Tax=Hallella absiana TaxID=2925336 RepID=UPI0021C5AAA7|nr:thiamine pyrophosphate-binding protein [Hallella absiana]